MTRLLTVEHLSKSYTLVERLVRAVAQARGADRYQPHRRRRRDAGDRRRERLRQDDARPLHHPGPAGERRAGHLPHQNVRRRRAHCAEQAAAQAVAARHPHDLPGPDELAQSQHAGVRHRRRALAHPSDGEGARARGPRGRHAREGRHPRRGARPLSACVLGRAAAAHRHRTGAGARPEARHRRRGRLRPRRLDPGAGPEPARRPQGRVRADLHLHQPRPRRGQLHRRPRGRDVPRPNRGERADRPPLRAAAPPLHRGAARSPAHRRPDPAQGPPDRSARRDPLPRQPAEGVPVPHPLPVCAGPLPHRGAGAAADQRADANSRPAISPKP